MRFLVIAGAGLLLMGCQSGPPRATGSPTIQSSQVVQAQPQQKLLKLMLRGPAYKPPANCALDRSGPSAYAPCP